MVWVYLLKMVFYRPQTKLWKGNVFTSVCQEFSPRGRGVSEQIPPWADTPREDPFPRSACWNTVHKRAVRIPLECILVNIKTHSLLCLFPGRHVVFSGWIMSKLDYVFIHCATELTSLYPLWFHRQTGQWQICLGLGRTPCQNILKGRKFHVRGVKM